MELIKEFNNLNELVILEVPTSTLEDIVHKYQNLKFIDFKPDGITPDMLPVIAENCKNLEIFAFKTPESNIETGFLGLNDQLPTLEENLKKIFVNNPKNFNGWT